MTVFAAAVEALFADVNLGTAAIFAPDGGSPISVRVIARQPDRLVAFGDARLASDSTLFDLRVGEVADPRAGDRLDVGAKSYIIFGEPTRDVERLVWTVSARPV